jgi:hypothetical protein
MHLGKIGIASDGREFGHQIDPLEQCLIGVLRIGVGRVVVEGDRAGLQFVHQISRGSPENIVGQEVLGKVIPVGEAFPEVDKFRAVREISEEEKEDRFLKTAVLLTVFEKIADTVSAIDQVALAGYHVSGFVSGISDNIADLGQTDADTGPVFVSKAFFDIVLFEKRIGDIRKIGGFPKETGQYIVIVKIEFTAHRQTPLDYCIQEFSISAYYNMILLF